MWIIALFDRKRSVQRSQKVVDLLFLSVTGHRYDESHPPCITSRNTQCAISMLYFDRSEVLRLLLYNISLDE